MTTKLFKFKDLEITPIKTWTKPYYKIKVPKGFRKIKVQELWDLLESDKSEDFLGEYKGKSNWFWCEQTKWAKRNNYASGLCLGRDLDLDSGSGSLAHSIGNGRVVFVKDGKK
jgi:hypothetical protein